MRRPEPYSSSSTAVSRAAIQSSSASGRASITSAALPTVSGLGMPCGTLGRPTCMTPRLWVISSASSQRKKVRSADMRARQRPTGEAVAAARGHEAAEHLGIEAGEVGQARRVAEVAFQPDQELAQVARVGFQRLVGRPALVRQMREPGVDRATQVVAQRQAAVGQNLLEWRRAHGFPFDSLVREHSAACG